MLRATFGSGRRSEANGSPSSAAPALFQHSIIPPLQSVCRWACTNPVYTVAFVALMASTSYVGLLQSDLFEPPASTYAAVGQIDLATLLTGSKTLYLGTETGWRWQNGDNEAEHARYPVCTPLNSTRCQGC